MDRIIHILLLLLLCGCSKGYAPDPPQVVACPTPNLTIAALHDLYLDTAVEVHQPLVVTGLVTTSDRAGNFYHTLIIEQEGHALEIMAGMDGLHNLYPIGCRLYLKLDGLTLERNRGVLQAGPKAPDYDYTSVGYFYSRVHLDEHLFRGAMEEPYPAVPVLHIDELTPADCGRLVMISNLKYAPLQEDTEDASENGEESMRSPESETTEEGWSGYRRFEDEAGNALHTYTSSYALYATHPLPEGRVALRGIVQQIERGEHAGYILKLRDERDILRY